MTDEEKTELILKAKVAIAAEYGEEYEEAADRVIRQLFDFISLLAATRELDKKKLARTVICCINEIQFITMIDLKRDSE